VRKGKERDNSDEDILNPKSINFFSEGEKKQKKTEAQLTQDKRQPFMH
jgi:hypothetical protein